MKTAFALILGMVVCAAFGYGYDVSMTEDGPAIAGYFGTLIPAAFVAIGAGLGMAIAA